MVGAVDDLIEEGICWAYPRLACIRLTVFSRCIRSISLVRRCSTLALFLIQLLYLVILDKGATTCTECNDLARHVDFCNLLQALLRHDIKVILALGQHGLIF